MQVNKQNKVYDSTRNKSFSNQAASIRFKNGDLNRLRNGLLSDLTNEHFAILLGKTEICNNNYIITIHDILFPQEGELLEQNLGFLRINKKFVATALLMLQKRIDVDTYIDVHTHPFSKNTVGFSSTDDADERSFSDYLAENFSKIKYASIVLSQESYSARYWFCGKQKYCNSEIKTQLKSEYFPVHHTPSMAIKEEAMQIYDRSILALGLETMKSIMSNEKIAIVGVGGLGSIIAENLIHMGFQNLILLDNDKLELSNLNRIVGAKYRQAKEGVIKVDAVAAHLKDINPFCKIETLAVNVHSGEAEKALAFSDWIIVATDNHASRFRVQEYAFKYYIPFISAGVNITVKDNNITDISGEVITIRIGDTICLDCLHRINYNAVAAER
jgi:molybdopterin/thiamine biosynthesis adenylyltransferase